MIGGMTQNLPMLYTITQGKGSQARIYEGLTSGEAIEQAEAMLAAGRRDVTISSRSGEVDLHALKLAHSTGRER